MLLPDAGGADHGERPARRDVERDVVKEGLAGRVGVAEVLHLEPGAGRAVRARRASPYGIWPVAVSTRETRS